MLDRGFMPLFLLRLSDRNVHGGGCVVATREKTAVLLSMDENRCLHYILFLMHLFVAHKKSLHCCNLILDMIWCLPDLSLQEPPR